jgi:hypothetical protein
MPHERDAMLRRFERNLAVVCLVLAVGAALLGRLDVAGGVLGGGLLAAAGYGAIKSAVDLLVVGALESDEPARRRVSLWRRVWIVVKFLGRYALLALGAYVMLTSLRMHPVGLLLGASAPVLSAVIELVRMSRTVAHPGHSR